MICEGPDPEFVFEKYMRLSIFTFATLEIKGKVTIQSDYEVFWGTDENGNTVNSDELIIDDMRINIGDFKWSGYENSTDYLFISANPNYNKGTVTHEFVGLTNLCANVYGTLYTSYAGEEDIHSLRNQTIEMDHSRRAGSEAIQCVLDEANNNISFSGSAKKILVTGESLLPSLGKWFVHNAYTTPLTLITILLSGVALKKKTL